MHWELSPLWPPLCIANQSRNLLAKICVSSSIPLQHWPRAWTKSSLYNSSIYFNSPQRSRPANERQTLLRTKMTNSWPVWKKSDTTLIGIQHQSVHRVWVYPKVYSMLQLSKSHARSGIVAHDPDDAECSFGMAKSKEVYTSWLLLHTHTHQIAIKNPPFTNDKQSATNVPSRKQHTNIFYLSRLARHQTLITNITQLVYTLPVLLRKSRTMKIAVSSVFLVLPILLLMIMQTGTHSVDGRFIYKTDKRKSAVVEAADAQLSTSQLISVPSKPCPQNKRMDNRGNCRRIPGKVRKCFNLSTTWDIRSRDNSDIQCKVRAFYLYIWVIYVLTARGRSARWLPYWYQWLF